MAAQKCKYMWLQAALNNFQSSTNPKQKKLSLSKKPLLLQGHSEENCKNRGF